MLAIDIALLVGGGALVAVLAGVVVGRLSDRNEARRRRKLGERNAAEEKRRLEERCAVCNEQVDPANDVHENGQWWHRRCYRELVS